MVGRFLCEVCYDALTDHMTAVWNGRDGRQYVMIVSRRQEGTRAGRKWAMSMGWQSCVSDEQGEGYLVRLRNGTTIRFRWSKPTAASQDGVSRRNLPRFTTPLSPIGPPVRHKSAVRP